MPRLEYGFSGATARIPVSRFGEAAVMQEYEKLRELVEAAADDVAKAIGGNKAAGTRVRKSMQDIKETAQSVRKKILEVRSTTPATET